MNGEGNITEVNCDFSIEVSKIYQGDLKLELLSLQHKLTQIQLKFYKQRVGIYFKFSSLSSGNTIVSRAGGLRFKSRADKIRHSVANDSPPLRYFFETSCVTRGQCCGDGPRKLVIRFGVIQ